MDRFTRAYQDGDVDALVALLTEDVLMTMPPVPLEYLGPRARRRFLRAAIFRPASPSARSRPGPTASPLMYQQPLTRTARATGVLVFTLSGSHVSAITRFDDTVLPRFGVPATLPG